MAKKEVVTFEMLKDLTQTYVSLLKNPMEESTDWAYACLEPVICKSSEATTALIEQLDAEEFDAIAPYFRDIIRKFQSPYLVEVIEKLYQAYHGNDTESEYYVLYIKGIRKHLKQNQ
jgi:hypothetical protein